MKKNDEQKNDSNAAAIIENARLAEGVGHRVSNVGKVSIALVPDGYNLQVMRDAMALDERLKEWPEVRHGQYRIDDSTSFVDFILRYRSEDTVVFADLSKMKMTSVFDFHPASSDRKAANWGQFHASYECPTTEEWDLWQSKSNAWMSQEDFADFIDERRADVFSGEGADGPSAAEMVKMARDLRIFSKGQFERTLNPTTGEYSLINKLEHAENSTRIPPRFCLRLAVFEGGSPYLVEVHLRMQVEGRAKFAFKLLNLDAIKRHAFRDITAALVEHKIPVFFGEVPRRNPHPLSFDR